MVLIVISLLASEAEHFFMGLFAVISSLMEGLFKSFALNKTVLLLEFFQSTIPNILLIFWILLFFQIRDFLIFSPSL